MCRGSTIADQSVLTDADRRGLAAAAQAALAPLDIASVRLGEIVAGGSLRSVVIRATAEPRLGSPFSVIVKAPLGDGAGFARERAALSLVRDHDLPGAVRLLGVGDDPRLLVLEDLGDGLTVADLLLGDDPAAAERAVIDWAVTIGNLQAASSKLGDDFRGRLASAASGHTAPQAPACVPSTNPLVEWISETADALAWLLQSWDVRPTETATDELRSIVNDPGPFTTACGGGLVPGDSCPDNAVYAAGQLTLIDFEAAAYRRPTWEAANLTVPWPTCWCSWKLPDEVSSRALDAWRQIITPSLPATAVDTLDDTLAQATIIWTFCSLTFLLPAAIRGPQLNMDTRQGPDLRSLVLHRLQTAAASPTTALPALRELAEQLHAAGTRLWGSHQLQIAPAFRA